MKVFKDVFKRLSYVVFMAAFLGINAYASECANGKMCLSAPPGAGGSLESYATYGNYIIKAVITIISVFFAWYWSKSIFQKSALEAVGIIAGFLGFNIIVWGV